MPGPVFEARIHANKSFKSSPETITQSWTLPLWFLPIKSPSVSMSKNNLLLTRRVAKQLGIHDGSTVEVDIPAFQVSLSLEVDLVDNSTSDLTLNGAIDVHIGGENNQKLIKQMIMSGDGNQFTTSTGVVINAPEQNLFWSTKILSPPTTSGIFFFDGASRHDPKGPAGYGYYITTKSGEELIKGYGYMSGKRSNNYMEYAGLIEGLNWALRLYFKKMEIRGDSELILKQVSGEYNVDNPRLKECCTQVKDLINGHRGKDVKYTWTKISRKDNQVSDTLANLGMDRMENKTVVNWVNVKKVVKR